MSSARQKAQKQPHWASPSLIALLVFDFVFCPQNAIGRRANQELQCLELQLLWAAPEEHKAHKQLAAQMSEEAWRTAHKVFCPILAKRGEALASAAAREIRAFLMRACADLFSCTRRLPLALSRSMSCRAYFALNASSLSLP